MARVPCEVRILDTEAGTGSTSGGIEITCDRCDHCITIHVNGTSGEDATIRKGMVLMREECPKGERNFYYQEED